MNLLNSWPASCVEGPPRVYPKYGDIAGAWAQKNKDAHQYIEVRDLSEVEGLDDHYKEFKGLIGIPLGLCNSTYFMYFVDIFIWSEKKEIIPYIKGDSS